MGELVVILANMGISQNHYSACRGRASNPGGREGYDDDIVAVEQLRVVAGLTDKTMGLRQR